MPESGYAWTRLFAALALSAIGGVGMWSVIVALPAVQAEFGVARSAASLPYTATMICFGFGGILMGRLADRLGIFVPVVGGALCLGLGYVVASQATSLWQFTLAQGLLVGVAGSVAFAPIIADTSLWFTRRRGMAVSIIASGSYLAGTVWPPVIQHFIDKGGWRWTFQGIAVFCVITMLPLALALRRRAPLTETAAATAHVTPWSPRPLGMSRSALQTLLIVAGLSCCVAMSMPQVHINAFSDELVVALGEALRRFDADAEAHVAVIHGKGRAFSSGADVRQRQLRSREEFERPGGPQGFGAHSGDLLTKSVNWKPVIAAPHGYVLGLAVGIVLESDLIVAEAGRSSRSRKRRAAWAGRSTGG